jgi:hypothetical protein
MLQARHSYNSTTQYKSLEDSNLQQWNEILHSQRRNNLHFSTSLETAAIFGIIKPFAFKTLIIRLLHLPMIQSDERWSMACLL